MIAPSSTNTFAMLAWLLALLVSSGFAQAVQPTGQQIEHEKLTEAAANIEKHRKGNVVLRIEDDNGSPLVDHSVSVKLIRHEFLFGANLTIITGKLGEINPIQHYGGKPRFTTQEQVDEYKARFTELFNFATVPFYWASLEPEQGEPKWQYPDDVIKWCLSEEIVVKGHTLVWTNPDGIPPWFSEHSPQEQRVQLEAHVKRTVLRYGGTVAYWDVVNEAGWNNTTLAGLEMSDYVNEPLEWARQSVPNVSLAVNDAHHLADVSHMDRAFGILSSIDQADYDVIGVQAHVDVNDRFRLETVQEVLERYSELGKAIHVTEFTPPSGGRPIKRSWKAGDWTEEEQADYAVKFYTLCFSLPYVESIGWWDLCDYGAWQSLGGLLREDLSPKPSYMALKRLIHSDWHTELEIQTDASGRIQFRGFYGSYEVTVETPAGITKSVTIDVQKGHANEFGIRL